MQDSTLIKDAEHNYSMQIPNVTPSGQMVEIVKSEHAGMHGVHAHSPDLSELYFELVSYPGLIDHEEAITGQKAFLSEQSSDARIADTKHSAIHTFKATEFRFEGTLQGRWKVRRFIFVDSPIRTYRIVYDHTSELNERVLDSLVVGIALGA
jgi:hypothetical protein